MQDFGATGTDLRLRYRSPAEHLTLLDTDCLWLVLRAGYALRLGRVRCKVTDEVVY
jgi:hypothetical protein